MTSFVRGALAGVGASAVVAAMMATFGPVEFTGSTATAAGKGKDLWHERAADRKPALPTGFSPLPSLAPLIKELKPAVVSVSTANVLRARRSPADEFFRHYFGHDEGPPGDRVLPRGVGSGFIIHESGLVLTNNHVIEGADQIGVKLADGREFKAEIVGRDPKTDVALLRMKNARDLPTVSLGDSDGLQVGDWVVAIGNPFGLSHSTSLGIVSAKERFIGAGPYDDFIQTDAAINPGNSGGPLFNASGEVVGINTAIVGQGIGFAVPINLVKALVPQLEASGRVVRGWLGVALQDVTPELSGSLGMDRARGALVAQVFPGSPAEQGGVHNGDVVLTVNGREVDGYAQMSRAVALNAPGSKVRLGVIRDGKPLDLTVTVSERTDEPRTVQAGTRRNPDEVQDPLGITVAPLPPQLARRTGGGVVVAAVEPGSPAARAGVSVNDVILEINRRRVGDVRDYVTAMRRVDSGNMVLLRIQRGDGAVYIAVRVG